MSMTGSIGLAYNSQLPEAAALVHSIVKSLDLRDRSWISSAGDLAEKSDELGRTSLVVVVGGDGTILRTVRVVAPFSVPLVGVNMGRVGFMAELAVEEAIEKLPAYLEGGMRVEERMMLQASVSHDDGTPGVTLHALNDVVVGRGGVARLLDIETSVDGAPLTSYRADAVVVSTPTGSTGYARSAGGPILYPEADVMLVKHVAAHTGLREGLVLPGDSVVELLASGSNRAMLSVDGSHDTALAAGDRVTVARSPYVARFMRAQQQGGFYASLTRRLGVAQRSRPLGVQ